MLDCPIQRHRTVHHMVQADRWDSHVYTTSGPSGGNMLMAGKLHLEAFGALHGVIEILKLDQNVHSLGSFEEQRLI